MSFWIDRNQLGGDPHATAAANDSTLNERVYIDGRSNVYINGGAGITVLTSHGSLRQVADGIAFANGMAIICIDADGAVWDADVPNKRCVRVREGGEVLQTVAVDRGCFACMLGGEAKKALFIIATEWRGMDKIAEVAQARTGQVLTFEAPVPHAGWP